MKNSIESSKQRSSTASRMGALHRATLSLFSDLSLDGVLRRIIHAARELSNARYAALGIPDGKGGLETFITLGLSEDEIQAMPHQPVGDGVIGEIIRSGRSIRIPNISDHPKSAGFPVNHPEMRSFLGVPIAAYGRPLGQIYLTDKRGADSFSAEDQRLIEMLASHAAAAIENARLHRKVLGSELELTQRNLELELVNALTTVVSSNLELNNLLKEMLDRVLQLFGASGGEFYLREEDGAYRKAIHGGNMEEAFYLKDRFSLDKGFVGYVAKIGKPVWTSDLAQEQHFFRPEIIHAGVGTIAGVPLTAPGNIMGILSLAFPGEREFQERDIRLLIAVGAGVGIAVENARLYRQARRLAVLEERERIAMDLHDGIIQSIYAEGLVLEYVRILFQENPEDADERMAQAIQGLNKVIRDIRSYILDLKPSRIQMDDLGAALEVLCREFKANTLVDVELNTEPEVFVKLSSSTATELFHITQEALANVAKHAKASRVCVNVHQIEGDLSLEVIDNGSGFVVDQAPGLLGHGLSNMRERVRQIGGTLQISSRLEEGTTVAVRLPMEETQ